MKHYVVYHSADFDGVFSGLITIKGLMEKGISEDDIITIGYNYQEKIEFYDEETKEKYDLSEVLNTCDEVYFVDVFYTRGREYVRKLLNTGAKIIVIDHHQSSIKMIEDNFANEIEFSGSKNSSDLSLWKNQHPESAALLCWRYFYPNQEPNQIIKFISDYDIWYRPDDEIWEKETLAFQFGLRSVAFDRFNIKNHIKDIPFYISSIENDFEPENREFINKIINIGRTIIDFNKERNRGVIKANGFKCTVHIKDKTFKGYVGSDYLNNSSLFEWGVGVDSDLYKEMEIFILARPVFGSTVSYISIISNRDEINAGDLCKSLGGGGHAKIGGCTVDVKRESIFDKDGKTIGSNVKLIQGDFK